MNKIPLMKNFTNLHNSINAIKFNIQMKKYICSKKTTLVVCIDSHIINIDNILFRVNKSSNECTCIENLMANIPGSICDFTNDVKIIFTNNIK